MLKNIINLTYFLSRASVLISVIGEYQDKSRTTYRSKYEFKKSTYITYNRYNNSHLIFSGILTNLKKYVDH